MKTPTNGTSPRSLTPCPAALTTTAVASLLTLLAPGALAQSCPSFTGDFSNAPLFDKEVRSVGRFDPGTGSRLYAAGLFTKVGQTQIRGIAQWTGADWAPVGSSLSGDGYWVGALDIGSGPALYVGGMFNSAGGTPASNVARWNGQAWSAMDTGFNGAVHTMTTFNAGSGPSIYAGGSFVCAGNTVVNGIARWTGSTWLPLGNGLVLGTSYPFQGTAYTLSIIDLGAGPRLYVGGRFDRAGGIDANNIAAWNGSQWSTFGTGVQGTDPRVMSVVAFDHGVGPQLTIGGRFSMGAEGQRPRVARWTGTQWAQVATPLSADVEHYIHSMTVAPSPAGPSLLVGGWFTGAAWLNNVNYIARLAGADWVGVQGGMAGTLPDSQVRSLTMLQEPAGPALYAAGAFKIAGDAIANRIARWDGQRWNGIEQNAGLTGPAQAACVYSDGATERLYVGGDFAGAGDRICNSIAAWDPAGPGSWHQVGGGVLLPDGTQGQVSALAVYTGALYATGLFTTAGGGPCFNIARWDGNYWSSPGGNGPNDAGRALAVYDDGSGSALYVGGAFGASAGIPTPGIVRWNGSAWSGVGTPSVGVAINALTVFDDGAGPALYAGGQFLQIGGIATPSLARWNGSAWAPVGGITISATNTFPGTVRALTVYDDGAGPSLFAAGSFAGAGSVPVHGNIARYRAGLWSALGTLQSMAPTGPLHALAVAPDGTRDSLYVGGQFTAAHAGSLCHSLVRWDGQAWSAVAQGVTAAPPLAGAGQVRALTPLGSAIFVAGAFGSATGAPADGYAEWRLCTCYADCNADTALTIADFACFQSRFATANPWADCNADSALTIQDFGCFQGKFANGCP